MAEEKWGEQYAKEFFPRGHKEIAQILPAFPDSVRVVEAPGLYGKPTSQEAAQEKDSYQEFLDKCAKEAAERQPEREEMGWER